MAEFMLKRQTALGGWRTEAGATVLHEVEGVQLTTVSLSAEASHDTELPKIGMSSIATDDKTHRLRLAADRLMILQLAGRDANDPAAEISDKPGYRVDQSDHWVLLELSGPLTVRALERSCRLDLDATVFVPGQLARTPIEGVTTILFRRAPDRFLLLAQRSYARTLANTLSTSLRYVAP